MRLLHFDPRGELRLTKDIPHTTYPYAILSHTWGRDEDEVTFDELRRGPDKSKAGYTKIVSCGKQAREDGLEYFWVDTCCIDKSSSSELSKAINSMFRWYRDADRCYVYLADVPLNRNDTRGTRQTWRPAFRKSRWFTRGWTLQELIAPASVEFFSAEWVRLGDKASLEIQLHEVTRIPIAALRGEPLSRFSEDERMRWAARRETKEEEDKAYCLLGIFDVSMPLVYGEGEKAFSRLMKEIREHANGVISGTGNVHWVVGRLSNPHFTGRQDILDDLEKIVRTTVHAGPRDTQCRIVITGVGGQGKSEICLQLAQRVRSLLWGIFWIDVSTPSLAENGFLDIAKRLNAPDPKWQDGRQGLAGSKQPWLLILDNADDPELDYAEYLPSGQLGVVILTSRNEGCKQYATVDSISLYGLPVDEAGNLVLKAASIADLQSSLQVSDAQKVAALLHSHPLALIQAGAYVARDHCTLAQYPQVFDTQRNRLLSFRPSQARSRYGDVYATFQASVEILRSSNTELSRDALDLLPLLAVVGPNQFPLFVFDAAWVEARVILGKPSGDGDLGELTSWHVSRLPAFMRANTQDQMSFRLKEAVHALQALALVSAKDQEGQMSVSMHPLTHAWAKDRQDECQWHESWVTMSCVVALSCKDGELWRVHERQLQPHLQALVAWDMDSMFGLEPKIQIAQILTEVGWRFIMMEEAPSLVRLLDRVFAHLGLDKSNVDESWIRLYHWRGVSLSRSGNPVEAIPILERAMQAYGKFAEDKAMELSSQHELARAYIENGQVLDAIEILESVVQIQERVLAEDDRERLTSQHELARAYIENAQVSDAIEILERVVQIEERVLAEDDRERLTSQHNLAICLWMDQRYPTALQMMGHVVHIKRKAFTEEHPFRKASEEWFETMQTEYAEMDKNESLNTEQAMGSASETENILHHQPSSTPPNKHQSQPVVVTDAPRQSSIVKPHIKLEDEDVARERTVAPSSQLSDRHSVHNQQRSYKQILNSFLHRSREDATPLSSSDNEGSERRERLRNRLSIRILKGRSSDTLTKS